MDIPPNSTAVAARSASSETRRTAEFRDRGALAGGALAGGAFAGRQVSTHLEDGQGLSVRARRETISGIDAMGERRLVGSRSSAPIRSVSDRPDSTTPQPGSRPTTVYARPLEEGHNPPGSQAQESDWFAVFYMLRVHRSHHARHSMAAAKRGYSAAISLITRGLTNIFMQFGNKAKDLPAAPFSITKGESLYYFLQEMARKSANEGFTERAEEILKALDDIKQQTAESMDELIESHGVPDLSAMDSIPSTASAGPSLTVETTPASVRASGQFDWLAAYRRLRGLVISYRGLDKPEAASDCELAVEHISQNLVRRLKKFGVNPGCLPVSERASKPELAYAALQGKARQTDDGLLRLGIRHSLFDIDQATLRKVNELMAKHRVPDKPSAHPTQVPASTGSPAETELPATSVTPVTEQPPVTVGPPVSAGAIPWPGQVPPGANPGLLGDADNPTGSPAQESEWFHEFYRLRVLRSEFEKRSETGAERDYRRALDRIRARVTRLFKLYDGSDKDQHGNSRFLTKPELMYRSLQKMACKTAKTGSAERAREIRKALDDLKQHATESMQRLIASHGVPGNTSAGETASPTAETATAPTGTPDPLDWLAVYRRLDILKQHHKTRGNGKAVLDINNARRCLKQKVLRKFSKLGGDIDRLPMSDHDSYPELAFKALHDMALQTEDELKAREIRLFLKEIDRTIIHDMNALARKLGVPEGGALDAAGMERSTIDPPATNSSIDAAQPAATGVTVTPQLGAQSVSRPHPAEPGQRSGTAVPEKGLHRADDSPRPPGATVPGDEHGEWADPWWPTHAEMPQPQRTELEAGEELTGTELTEFDELLKVADAVLQPPPIPSTVGVPPEAARAPLTPTPAMPGCQLAGSPDFVHLAEGSGGVPFSRRAQIVHHFSTNEAFLKAEIAFYEGHTRALGWSAKRCREVQGELLRLHVTAVAGFGTAEALEDINWSALEALMRFLDTPADLP